MIVELLFIAFLGYFILQNVQSEPAPPVYERFYLFLPSEGKYPLFNGALSLFDGEVILKQYKHKKAINLSLLGDREEDDKRMGFIRFKARELLFTNDTTQYIKISLSSTLTYSQFMNLIRMVNEDKHKRYMLYKDNFYIFSDPSPSPHEKKVDNEGETGIEPIYL